MTLLQKILKDLVRLLRVGIELIWGFDRFGRQKAVISIFGSARFSDTHPSCEQARFLARRLGSEGFTILTGGGPGVMEAANRGAYEIGAPSIACNITLPHEQHANRYAGYVMTMRYFFTRKYMLISYSLGFVIFPGGFGTLDEFFEILTLLQTKKLKNRPVYLIGTEYWSGMLDWMKEKMLAEKAIDEKSLALFRLTDDLEEVFEGLKRTKYEVDHSRKSHPINSEA